MATLLRGVRVSRGLHAGAVRARQPAPGRDPGAARARAAPPRARLRRRRGAGRTARPRRRDGGLRRGPCGRDGPRGPPDPHPGRGARQVRPAALRRPAGRDPCPPHRPALLRDCPGRGRGARRGGLRGRHGASRRAPRPGAHHDVVAERQRGGRQERGQPPRGEELRRRLRAALGGAQRLRPAARPARARAARGHRRGGEGGADPRPGLLRVARREHARARGLRARGGGVDDPPLRGAAHAPDRARRRSVRDGLGAAPRFRPLGPPTSSRR